MSTDAGGQTQAAGRAAAAVRDLHPGYFAFVMATGIISDGTFLLGPSWRSQAQAQAVAASIAIALTSRPDKAVSRLSATC